MTDTENKHKNSDLRIVSPQDSADLDRFVDFPWQLYDENYPLWVPSLREQEKILLTQDKHPFWEKAVGRLFMAFRGDELVGRITAVIDENYNVYAKQRCGAWGFFECREDQEAAFALFAAAEAWLKAEGMTYMRGPLSPSTNYTCGVLVKGFEEAPAVMMPWNPPYYPAFMEQWGMRKEMDLFAYTIEKETLSLPDWLKEQIAIAKQQALFTCRRSSRKTLEEDIRAMLRIYGESWSKNWGFTPLSDKEAALYVKELKGVLDPDFFVLFFRDKEPVAGMVALPNLNPLLKRINGHLGVSALWHYIRLRRTIREQYRIMLFGIREEYRLMGLPFLLLDHMLETAQRRSEFRSIEGSWLLEDNAPICELLEDFCGRITKRYRIYRKELS